MKTHLILPALFATLMGTAAFADDAKATADAKAVSSTTTTTNVNGKPVTIIEDQDENGKKRIRMITYVGGKPKVKEITPKEKQRIEKEDPFAKLKPVGPAK